MVLVYLPLPFFNNKTDIFDLLPPEFLTFFFNDAAKGMMGIFFGLFLIKYSGLQFFSHWYSWCGGIIVSSLMFSRVTYSFQMVKQLEKVNKRWFVFSVAVSPSPGRNQLPRYSLTVVFSWLPAPTPTGTIWCLIAKVFIVNERNVS